MLSMYKQITIRTLKKQGKTNIDIASDVDCHRNTVRNVLKRDRLLDQVTRNKSSFFDQFYDTIKQLLDKKTTRLRIYEILCEDHQLERSYDSLCKYIQKHFPKKVEAYGVQTVEAGEEAEVDFGYVGMQPTPEPNPPEPNPSGSSKQTCKTWALAIKLSYSRDSYYELTIDQKVGTLIAALTRAFEYWGGVPKRLKVDNLRAAILKNQYYDIQFNQDFLEWAHHYGCVIVPCTPYHPEQKGKVESDVKYVKGNFFCEREFTDHNDMKKQLKIWMKTYANQRIHQTTKQVPHQVFDQEEKDQLQPLPTEPFSFFNRDRRKVGKHCHIFFQNNYYSVPSSYVGKQVTIRWNNQLIRIISQEKESLGEQLAVHVLVTNGQQGQYVTCRSHLPDYKCYSQTEYQKKYEAKMIEVGEHAQQYFKQLLLKKESYWFRSVRIILGLVQEYGKEAVNLSLRRALTYQVLDIPTIKNIVKDQLYLLADEPILLQTSDTNNTNTNNTNTNTNNTKQYPVGRQPVEQQQQPVEQQSLFHQVIQTLMGKKVKTLQAQIQAQQAQIQAQTLTQSEIQSNVSQSNASQSNAAKIELNRDLNYYQNL